MLPTPHINPRVRVFDQNSKFEMDDIEREWTYPTVRMHPAVMRSSPGIWETWVMSASDMGYPVMELPEAKCWTVPNMPHSS